MPPKKPKNLSIIPPEEKSILPVEETLPITADRINNIAQKETAAFKAGVTRKLALEALAEGLKAVKTIEENGYYVDKPDTAARTKAAETILKFFGDMKDFQAAVDNSRHTHVTYQWKTAPIINVTSPRVQ